MACLDPHARAAFRSRHVYVKIALLALAAVVAFLGAAVIGVPSSPERRIGMFISLPWADQR
jgi:hypothetical protein